MVHHVRQATAWVLLLGLLASCSALRPRPSQDELEEAARQKVKMQAAMRSYMGTRYHLGGVSHQGIDCSGFNVRIFQAAGVKLPRTARQQFDEGRSVPRAQLQFGDLLFFNTKRLATTQCAGVVGFFTPGADVPLFYGVTHTGIYVGEGRFIHASPSMGVSYARMDDDYWADRYVGARRVLLDFPDDE